MAKDIIKCSRCGRFRYGDRLRPMTWDGYPGRWFFVCTAKATCRNEGKKARKAEKLALSGS